MAQRITRRLFNMINAQANRELEASMMYYSMSLWFDSNNLPGSKQWCKTHSDEERNHSQRFFEHLSDRRIVTDDQNKDPMLIPDYGSAASSSVKEGEFEWESDAQIKLDLNKSSFVTRYTNPLQIWSTAYLQEQENSKYIHDILKEARKVDDYTTENLITGFFIQEQLKEEKAVEEILRNAQLVCQKGSALYFELDKQMPKKPH